MSPNTPHFAMMLPPTKDPSINNDGMIEVPLESSSSDRRQQQRGRAAADGGAGDIKVQIALLRQQLEALQQIEQGYYTPGSTTNTTTKKSPPVPPTAKNFAIQEHPSSSMIEPSSSSKRGNNQRKPVSIIIWIIILVGASIGIVSLVNFMKENGIQFTQGEAGSTSVTLSELALHDTPDDCWVVYHGFVYDMTAYAKRHPGGSRIITKLAGKDGTDDYDKFHSKSLLDSVQGDIIGPLIVTDTSASTFSNNFDGTNSNGNDGNPVTDSEGCSKDSSCITFEELAKHDTAKNCWFAMHGNVYDMTSYANRHPGGSRTITRNCGIDGTTDYSRFHGRGLLATVEGEMIGRFAGGGSSGTATGGTWNDDGMMESKDSKD